MSVSALAQAGKERVPHGSVPKLDHVFVIMMENHLQQEIIGNANAPFMNQKAKEAGQATNYCGDGHPSLINYLELTGGSNFGITNDDPLNWVSGPCQSNQYATDCSGAVRAARL